MKALESFFVKGPYAPLGLEAEVWWMGNLGVVPWFLFLAFLLAPVFFFLLALFVFVFLVRETMGILLKTDPISIFKVPFIATMPSLVKTLSLFLLLLPGIATPLFCAPSPPTNDRIISIGEHLEVPSQGLRRFSVTAKDVIAYKWLEHRKLFLVEGKKLGYSELIIWNAKNQKSTHRFYVLSKRSFLKIKQIQKTLEGMGLQTSRGGPILVAHGQIFKERDYFILHKILAQNPKNLHLDVGLARPLRNTLIGKAYTILFEELSSGISCTWSNIQITCFYQKEDSLSQEIAKKLKRDYFIRLVAKSLGKAAQNYRIRLLIFQLERTDGKEISLGLDGLRVSSEELFDRGIKAFVAQNGVVLKENHIKVSTLAWPEVLAVPYKESTVEMGADVPYPSKGKDGKEAVNWKFAGIRLKMTLRPHGHLVEVHYLTEVKRPGPKGHIKGGLNRSVSRLHLGKAQEIFQIGLQTVQNQKGSLPWARALPLIGRLFTSSGKGRHFKKIIAYMKVERAP
ncbi:MAG: hypothetical protein OXB88_07620 [Bacteriovoracales bacterium]|nr:hypothetical protein [Bacteriovoracales bacterium]